MELADWQGWWKQRGTRGVRRILMESWDPIGVADVPEAADEYDSYVGPVGRQLRGGATADDLARYLHHVRVRLMGLAWEGGRALDRAAAEQLVDWYAGEMRAREA